MMPEIEELKKLAAGTINKGRLPIIRGAMARAQELYGRLEPKSEDEDTTMEFEDAESQLDDALSGLETACDELEDADDKESRDDAVEQIESALDDAVTSLEAIMEVAVVSSVDLRAMREECLAKLKGILVLPPEQRGGALETWIESAPTKGAKLQRANVMQEILASMQNNQSGSAPADAS